MEEAKLKRLHIAGFHLVYDIPEKAKNNREENRSLLGAKCRGRTAATGHREYFETHVNILHLDCGGGYMTASVCQHSKKFLTLGDTKKSDFYCMQIYLDKKPNLKKIQKEKSGLRQ